jgi:hypothetical protein
MKVLPNEKSNVLAQTKGWSLERARGYFRREKISPAWSKVPGLSAEWNRRVPPGFAGRLLRPWSGNFVARNRATAISAFECPEIQQALR